MPSPPTFQRAPRIYPQLPSGEVEIPRPPAESAAPAGSVAAVLVPRLTAAGGLLITAVLLIASGRWELAVVSLVITLASAGVAVYMFIKQRGSHTRGATERQEKYRAALATRKEELAAVRDKQRDALVQMDPSPTECLDRAQRLERRLWERSPHDSDFLSLRLGLGSAPFCVNVRPPRQEATFEVDPLLQEAQSLANDFSQVRDAPVHLPLFQAGATGLAGPRTAANEEARALAMQIATHHSPDEVKIVALFPNDEANEWAWLRWLPHTWSDDRSRRFLASDRESSNSTLKSLYEMLGRRRSLVATSNERNPLPPMPAFVFFLAAPDLLARSPIARLLLQEGRQLGAFSVFLADSVDNLPKGCNAMVDLNQNPAQLIQSVPERLRTTFSPDSAPVDVADRLARALAPVRLGSVAGVEEIPDSVSLLQVLGVRSVDEIDPAGMWRAARAYDSLAVPIGKRTGDEALLLDLHERGHGPHGLVAGTTGAGKSELLQTLVASLATHFHPHELVIMLVDFKGGETAKAFRDLPHLVGSVTNLEGNLISRAVIALESEVRRRQALLATTARSHADYLQRYHRGEVTEPLPHMVLIVDEFAELASTQPDLVKQLVSTARVGRSLGVHLILATQKPAGVVSDQIWSNTRFRICLRVERPEDSREVLKRPDAATITQAGRAYFQVGNNEIFELFQSAWSGAPYMPDAAAPSSREDIEEVALDGSRHSLSSPAAPISTGATEASTQLEALVAHLSRAARRAGIKRLPGPWAPPLPDAVPLNQVVPAGAWDGRAWRGNGAWLEPVVGLLDDPASQYQGPFSLNIGKDGHLLVYGGPGSGKSTFVQTLVTSLALAHSPEDLNLYILDFGGRSLGALSRLPHVGGVVLPDESERVLRLLRDLLKELEMRVSHFSSAGVSTLEAYRSATGEKLPAIVLVVDNYSAFAAGYLDSIDSLAQLAREGAAAGIYVVITAHGPNLVPSRISGNISQVVALPLTDRADYTNAMQQVVGMLPRALPGRGLLKGSPLREVQIALPASAGADSGRLAALRTFAEQMDQSWAGRRATPIRVLPENLPLCEMLPPASNWPEFGGGPLSVPLGLDAESLEPVSVSMASSHFLVNGPPQSGKTTLLQSWALALAEKYSPDLLNLYLVDFQHAGLLPLRSLPQVGAYIDSSDALGLALVQITSTLQQRRQAIDQARRAAEDDTQGSAEESRLLYPAIVMLIDDFDAVRDQAQAGHKTQIEQLVRRERGLGFHVVLAGASSDLGSSFEGLAKALKELQTGFVLGSAEQTDTQVLNLRLPTGEAGKSLSPGLGYYVRRGRFAKVKVATPHAGPVQLREWASRVAARS